MIKANDFYAHGLALYGHQCPAMLMGLRGRLKRAAEGQRLALLELARAIAPPALPTASRWSPATPSGPERSTGIREARSLA
ncbi:hypothetical protein [Thermochromatium tepidum]|uniref:Uncharacterized protein n=1 Tax=Thermochromatium tepidum ATCC 43061 TaxID=316276 RepID=A0A6I6EDL1_THETI|nr:hypothetical protein [Thermochromatium tepidum]QGU32200.1 hypothetical protein E6P07_03880 [Thermochromatium tepidum ATCC 43061]